MSGLTLVQLTDTHLLPEPELLFGKLNTWQRTISAVSAAAHFSPDALLVTGDIADSKSSIYQQASRLFDSASQQLGCPIIVLPGNHDQPDTVPPLFNRDRTATGPTPGDTVHQLKGLRVIAMDSDNPGHPDGALSEEQLDWLCGQLAFQSDGGTILALHHPPIESVLPQLAGRGLANPDRLAAVIEGTDVRAVLCGHYHHAASGWLGTVPVWVSPAVAYNQNLFAPAPTIQAVDSTWLSVIELGPTGFSATPVPVTATGTPVFTSTITPTTRAFNLHTVQGDNHAAQR